MTATRSAALVSMILATIAGPAGAQPSDDDEPQPHAAATPPTVPDATLHALHGHVLAITQRSGTVLVGEILGFDAATMTLALAPSRAIVTIARADVTALHLADGAVSPAAATLELKMAPPGPPERARHFGLQLGLAPGATIDLEAGHFYGFANADIVLPLADAGGLLGFSVGAGVTFSLSSNSRWKMDVFAHFHLARFGDSNGATYNADGTYSAAGNGVSLGGGFGLGFHYTAPNGLTFGIKTPVLGYSGYTAGANDAGTGVAYYYLGALMSLPVFSLGYRF